MTTMRKISVYIPEHIYQTLLKRQDTTMLVEGRLNVTISELIVGVLEEKFKVVRIRDG